MRLILKAGGEGSRGGRVIGHTRSGKPVYLSPKGDSFKHSRTWTFTAADHDDAVKLHRAAAAARPKGYEDEKYDHMSHASAHEGMARDKRKFHGGGADPKAGPPRPVLTDQQRRQRLADAPVTVVEATKPSSGFKIPPPPDLKKAHVDGPIAACPGCA